MPETAAIYTVAIDITALLAQFVANGVDPIDQRRLPFLQLGHLPQDLGLGRSFAARGLNLLCTGIGDMVFQKCPPAIRLYDQIFPGQGFEQVLKLPDGNFRIACSGRCRRSAAAAPMDTADPPADTKRATVKNRPFFNHS
jgi:hypothetical protein